MTIRQWVGMLAMAALVLADQSTLGAVSCFFPIAGTQLFDGGANVLKPDLLGWFHALAVDSH